MKSIISALQRIDPLWQTGIVAGLALLQLAATVWGGAVHSETLALVTGYVTPALLAVTAMLWVILFAIRRRTLRGRDIQCLKSYFQNPEAFPDLFSGRVLFSPGRIVFSGSVDREEGMRPPGSTEDIRHISEINRKAFTRTEWTDSEERKFTRNLAMWEKNPSCFMIFDWTDGAAGDNAPLFFSCILPLNRTGFRRYFTDRVAGDNDFRADWIAAPDEEADSVLLFTIARHPELVRKLPKAERDKLLLRYLRVLCGHLQIVLRENFADRESVSVYFQNSDKSFARLARLAGMDESGLRSRDNEIVYVTTVEGWGKP